MHNGRPALVVLILRDPHLLERGQRRQDRPADPDRVLALWRRDYFHVHRLGRHGRQLLLQARLDVFVHRRAARQNHVFVQVLADVHVALEDRLVRHNVHAAVLFAQERRLEQYLRCAEALAGDGDDLAVRKLKVALALGAAGGYLCLVVEV